METLISIIVPAYNSEATLNSCLEAIKNSNSKNLELIVINDGSNDQTAQIANNYTDKVIIHDKNHGRTYARNSGISQAKGDILVFIDSDVVISENSLSKIVDYFYMHPQVDALTGLLSKEHPNRNFFSQYKNLYMNYTFKKLPDEVYFLYGSINAIRKKSLVSYEHDIKIADDINLGQKLASQNKTIAFLKDLEVVHLKRYSFFSWVHNDFKIPFDMAQIFLKYKGWKHLVKKSIGFAHVPKENLISILLVYAIGFLPFISTFGYQLSTAILTLALGWILLNVQFFYFLTKEKGLIFGALSVPVTFFDHVVMGLGVSCGFVAYVSEQILFQFYRKLREMRAS